MDGTALSITGQMPAIFFGHGNPMNALQHNTYTEGWAAIGASIPRPKDAMLSIPTPEHYLPLLYVMALQGTRYLISS